jgi:hypothetical protein
VEAVLVAGIVIVVLLLVAAGVVGFLLFAWLRHVWRDLRGTPTFSQVARGARMARPLLAYRDVLRLAPSAAAPLTFRIQRKAMALATIRDQLGAEERFRLDETTGRYLPDTMNAFRMAVTTREPAGRGEASQLLMDQLSQLDSNLDRIAGSAGETGMAALRANGVFLGEISADMRERAPGQLDAGEHPQEQASLPEQTPQPERKPQP